MEKKIRSESIGEVVGTSQNQTVLVEIFRTYRHPQYGKYMKTSKVFPTHDPKGQASLGDKVSIVGCRPISKTKKWRLARILVKAGERGVDI